MATNTAIMFQNLRRQRIPPLPSIRDLLKLYQLNAIKQLSQNFLLDVKLTSKIVKSAGNITDCVVCEVGPGPGGITRAILERGAAKVVLIEKDKRFDALLKILADACPGKIETFWGDVLSFEMSKMFPEELRTPWDESCPKIHIVGNLPFSISTPLISRWFSDIASRRSAWSYGRVPLTLTFQQEVAERLTADASSEQRSRLSVMSEYLTHRNFKFTIKGSAFIPKPDVNVGVVKFVPRKQPLIDQPFPLVEKLVRQTFCMKGKYCCRPISTLFPRIARSTFTKMLFDASLVFANTRPYELEIEDFQRLCDAYAEICKTYPEIGEYEYRGVRADEKWEAAYAAKYEPFKDPVEIRAARINPLDMVAENLAADCADEILQEELDNEHVIVIK